MRCGGKPLSQTQEKRDTRGTEGREEEMRTEAEVEEGPREIQPLGSVSLVKAGRFPWGRVHLRCPWLLTDSFAHSRPGPWSELRRPGAARSGQGWGP